jgi:hypothetical protein
MSNILETDVQRWLAFLLRGKREEILVNVGRLDIIVREDDIEYVIEVKRGSQFLSAIGQLVGYTHALSKDKKNITRVRIMALFEWKSMGPSRWQACQDICANNDIHVWFLDEHFLHFLYDLERTRVVSGNDITPSSYFLDQFTCKRIRDDDRLKFRNRMLERVIDDEVDFVIEEDLNHRVKAMEI